MHDHFRDAGFGEFISSTQQMRDSALLRATTELFVQELIHDRDEIQRYEELATHLLAKVPDGDRGYVAERLAIRLDAPLGVMRLLAKDKIEIAQPVLKHSPVLGPLDLLSVIAATGPQHHRLIAERQGLAIEVQEALRISAVRSGIPPDDRADQGAARAGAPKADIPPPPADASPLAEGAAPGSGRFDPWRFLALERPERLKIMAELASRPPIRHYAGPSGRLDRAFRAILSAAQVVGFARGGQRQALIDAIAETLALDPRFVVASLEDSSGEPLAVLLKALGLDNIQAQQVFLLATSTVGQDVTIFFRLCDLYAGMEPVVAETLSEAWRAPSRPAAPRHVPVFAENGDRRRAGMPEASRESAPPAERIANRPAG